MRRGTGFPECAVRRETVPSRFDPETRLERRRGRPGSRGSGTPATALSGPENGPGGPFRGSGRAGNPRFRPQERRTGPPGRFRGSSLRGSRQRKRAAGRRGRGASPRLPVVAIRSSLPPARLAGNPSMTCMAGPRCSPIPATPSSPSGLPRPCGGPSLAPRRRCDSLSFVSWRREGRAVAARCRPARPGPRPDPRSLSVSGDPGSRPADPPRPRCLPPWAGASVCRSLQIAANLGRHVYTFVAGRRMRSCPPTAKSLPYWGFRHVGRLSGFARGRVPGQTALSSTRGAVSRTVCARFRHEKGGLTEEPETAGGPRGGAIRALTPAGHGCQVRPRKGAGGLMPIAARSPFAAARLVTATRPGPVCPCPPPLPAGASRRVPPCWEGRKGAAMQRADAGPFPPARPEPPVAGRRDPGQTAAGVAARRQSRLDQGRPRRSPASRNFHRLPGPGSARTPCRSVFVSGDPNIRPPGRSAAASMPAVPSRSIRPSIIANRRVSRQARLRIRRKTPNGFPCADGKKPCVVGVSGTRGGSQASLAGGCPGKRPSARRERPFRGRPGAGFGANQGVRGKDREQRAARAGPIRRCSGPRPGLGLRPACRPGRRQAPCVGRPRGGRGP